jgi:hypothetical protein
MGGTTPLSMSRLTEPPRGKAVLSHTIDVPGLARARGKAGDRAPRAILCIRHDGNISEREDQSFLILSNLVLVSPFATAQQIRRHHVAVQFIGLFLICFTSFRTDLYLLHPHMVWSRQASRQNRLCYRPVRHLAPGANLDE